MLQGEWLVLVPVKDLTRGKSRLALPEELRPIFTFALAADTVEAVVAGVGARAVRLVTQREEDLARLRERFGVDGVVDADRSLNDALMAATVPGTATAVVQGDLAGLQPSDLMELLNRVSAGERAVVGDAEGVGTAMLFAGDGALRPAFGPGSREAHVRSGATDLSAVAPNRARRDIDQRSDLASALANGELGRETTALLEKHPDLLDDF